jgi:hypothetical protein
MIRRAKTVFLGGFTAVRTNPTRVGQRSFDPQTVPLSRWLAGGGALVLLVSLFLSWFDTNGYSQTGWDAFDGDRLIGLFALVAIALVGLDLFGAVLRLPVDPAQLLLGCGGLSLFIVVLRLIDLSGFQPGIYLAFVAAAALTAGGWLELRD